MIISIQHTTIGLRASYKLNSKILRSRLSDDILLLAEKQNSRDGYYKTLIDAIKSFGK